jgi:hypothetical protein
MASARPDLTALLYLNPELEAFSNVRSIEDAAAGNYAATLPRAMPVLPATFDARVYLAAQRDISGLNETIRVAMRAVGLTDAAVHRRGSFVSTFMEPLVLLGDNTFQLRSNATIAFSTCNLASGDIVRILRDAPRGDAIVGTVLTVPGTNLFTFSNARADVVDPTLEYTLQGIKVWDAERQARVGYVRTVPYGAGSNDINQVPRADFREDVYHAVYPDTRAFDYPNTYLDYRQRWRQGLHRIANGDEINQGSNGGGGGGGGISGNAFLTTLVVADAASFGAGNLIVTSTEATLRSGIQAAQCNLVLTSSNVTVGRGASNLVIDGALSNGTVSLAASNVVVTPSGLSVRSDAAFGCNASVAGGLGIGFAAPDPNMCGTRLAVDGDIFTTGTVISLSDARAKTNIERIDHPLERIARLRGVTFEQRFPNTPEGGGPSTESARRHTGLLAQDVEAVLPEAIYEARRPPSSSTMSSSSDVTPLRSVAYGNLAGLMVEAINALAGRVNDMSRVSPRTTIRVDSGVDPGVDSSVDPGVDSGRVKGKVRRRRMPPPLSPLPAALPSR